MFINYRYITLFVVSGSIIKLFSIDYVNIYFFSVFFNRFCPVEKSGVTTHCLYRDLLTLFFTSVYLLYAKIFCSYMFKVGDKNTSGDTFTVNRETSHQINPVLLFQTRIVNSVLRYFCCREKKPFLKILEKL